MTKWSVQKRMLRNVLIVASACLLLNGCIFIVGARVWRSETTDLVLPAENLKAVAVTTHNGHIVAQGSEGLNEIRIHVIKRAGAASQEEAIACLKAITIETTVENGVQKIGWRWTGDRDSEWQEQVAFEIVMPSRLVTEAKSHNGAINIKGMTAEARGKTNNGKVTIQQTRGRVLAETDNGAIEVTEHTGELEARTNNGAIDVDSSTPKVALTTQNGRIAARLDHDGAFDGSAITQNGAIDLVFSESASMQLTCRTSNGHIQANGPIRTIQSDKKLLIGQIGDGAGKFEATTQNGAITVN